MQLIHQFTVPAPIDEAWKTLLDVPRVAPCMPGATLDEFDGSGFSGSVKVKLGPMTLLYRGQGRLVETDEAAHRLVMEASGKESRGSGTAAATVTASMTANGDTTQVHVTTDLKITGRPAQFGRGLLNDVGGKLLGQFSDCLSTTLGAPSAVSAGGAAGGMTGAQGAAERRGSGQQAEPGPVHPDLGDRGSVEDAEAERAPVDVEPIDLLEVTGAQDALRRYGPYAAAVAALVALVWIILRRRRD